MKETFIQFTANYFFIIPVLAATIIVLKQKNRAEVLVRGGLAGICALIIDKSSGLVYYHQRPFEQLGTNALAVNPSNNSFPSDHALLVFTAALVAWIATKNWKLGVVLMLCGVIVGWSRVLALVHWPVDIVGSAFISAAMVAVWFSMPLYSWMARATRRIKGFLDRKLPINV